MSKRYLKQAAADRRLAVCPEWLQHGRTVWYWRECLCLDELCPDSVTTCCPINNGFRPGDPAALACARQHPQLENTMVWSVCAYFTPRGVEWSVNDLPGVPDHMMRKVFFPCRADALAQRPREVI